MIFSIKGYTDTQEIEFTPFVVSCNITNTTRSPYHRASISCKIPFELLEDLLPDNFSDLLSAWVVIKKEKDTLFFGKVSSFNTGVSVRSGEDSAGLKETLPLSISVESFLYPMMVGQTYLSGLELGVEGHIFDLETWGAKLKTLLTAPFSSKKLGAVLETIFLEFAQYYTFPKKLDL